MTTSFNPGRFGGSRSDEVKAMMLQSRKVNLLRYGRGRDIVVLLRLEICIPLALLLMILRMLRLLDP